VVRYKCINARRERDGEEVIEEDEDFNQVSNEVIDSKLKVRVLFSRR
jgi:hypothetical protein